MTTQYAIYVEGEGCICDRRLPCEQVMFYAKACLINAFWCGVRVCGNAILNSISRFPLWLDSPTAGIPSPTTFFL